MRFYKLLSFRLFTLIFLILTTFTILFSFYILKLETGQYEEVARQCAKRTSEIVSGSTRHSMLLNQKEHTYEIMKSIVGRQGIEKISLYDKKGRIVFSTSEDEIDKVADMEDRACAVCHEKSGELKENPTNLWHNISEDKNGTRHLSYLTPIINEKSCSTSECHFHKKDETFLGLICLKMSLESMDKTVEENKARMISTNILITFILSLLVGAFIWIFVHLPVNKLILGTKEISSGNISGVPSP